MANVIKKTGHRFSQGKPTNLSTNKGRKMGGVVPVPIRGRAWCNNAMVQVQGEGVGIRGSTDPTAG
jgi:hypothetical protein